MTATTRTGPPRTVGHRISAFFYRHPRVKLALTLTPPLLWLGVVYLGSLAALVWQSFYRLDDFTGVVDEHLTLDTWRKLFTATTRDTVVRTASMAAAVTVGCVLVSYPLSYYLARRASPRVKTLLYLGVILPLWASYIVRVYAWRNILSTEGVLYWFADHLALTWLVDAVVDAPFIGGATLSDSWAGQWMVFVYIWLPYMILPIQAALERVPSSLLEASADLGARPRGTFWSVTWPLAIPGVVAGSIFTFSLTLGDYIIPTLVGPSKPTIGRAIYQFQGTGGDLPLAAAYTVIPIVIMAVYLTLARRSGAFEAL